MKNLLLLQQNI